MNFVRRRRVSTVVVGSKPVRAIFSAIYRDRHRQQSDCASANLDPTAALSINVRTGARLGAGHRGDAASVNPLAAILSAGGCCSIHLGLRCRAVQSSAPSPRCWRTGKLQPRTWADQFHTGSDRRGFFDDSAHSRHGCAMSGSVEKASYLTFEDRAPGVVLDAACVRGLLRQHDLATPRSTPRVVLGFTRCAAGDLPVVDLARKLGLAHGTRGKRPCIVIVEAEGGRLVGLLCRSRLGDLVLRKRDFSRRVGGVNGRLRRVLAPGRDPDRRGLGRHLVRWSVGRTWARMLSRKMPTRVLILLECSRRSGQEDHSQHAHAPAASAR